MGILDLRDWAEKLAEELYIDLDPQSLVRDSIVYHNGEILLTGMDASEWTSRSLFGVDKDVMLLSLGKAACAMMTGAWSALEKNGIGINDLSVAVTPYADTINHDFDVLPAGHPLPDKETERSTEEVLSRLEDLEEGTSHLLLLSGGSSSSLEIPRCGITVDDISSVTEEMLKAGSDIEELNTVRTYISDVKGGGLLRYIGKRNQASLVISDVVTDDPRFIGSGPTHPWHPDGKEVMRILNSTSVPSRIRSEIATLPPPDLETSGEHPLLLIANNLTAVESCGRLLQRRGYDPYISRHIYTGEAKRTGRSILRKARNIEQKMNKDSFIEGGESTVNVKGAGIGGRNTEMSLSLARDLVEGEVVICLSTDGVDGKSESAGGIVYHQMMESATSLSEIEDYLSENDSASLLGRMGGLIKTGPSGTNLGDLFIHLASAGGPHRLRR